MQKLFKHLHALGLGILLSTASLDAVVIFESGGVERAVQEYAGHHLPTDIAFLKQITSVRLKIESI